MKLFLVFAALIALSSAGSGKQINFDQLKIDLPKDLVENFMRDLEAVKGNLEAITALLNEYTDKILANLKNVIIDNGLDPMELPDISQDLIPMGHMTLDNGWLQDTSTIHRYGDVVATYDHATEKYSLNVPISFDALQFTYDYKVKVLLITYDGGVIGKVKDFKLDLVLGFDFVLYQASLDKFDITDTGTISLKFTGNALIDWLVNAMSSVITFILHPIIINIIQSLVKGGVESIVDLVNSIIYNFLHPTTTAAPTAFYNL